MGQLLSARALAALSVLVVACSSAERATPPLPSVDLGTIAVEGPDGNAVHLSHLIGQNPLTLMVFWSGGCPCVRRYRGRIEALAQRYTPLGVRVLAVAANADESAADVAQARSDGASAIPIWRDPQGKLATALDVKSTPTAVVLGQAGQVVYRGWIDNEREPGRPDRQAWLEAALDRALAGDLHLETRPTWGCRITAGWDDSTPVPPPGRAALPTPDPTPCGCRKDAEADAKPHRTVGESP